MGSAVSKQKFQLLIIIDPNFFKQGNQDILLFNKYPTVKFQFFEKVDDAFQKKSAQELKYIVTNNTLKTQILKKCIKHHLAKSKLYIYTKQSQISQEDFENVYITLITSDFQRILKHIVVNTKRQLYVPLYKIKLQTQKKIHMKIIDAQVVQPNVYDNRIKLIRSLNLSYELFDSVSKFQNSILLSKSDYIISSSDYLEEVIQIINKNYKNCKVICLDQLNKQIKISTQIRIQVCSFKQMIQKVNADKKKKGCKIMEIKKILIINYVYNQKKNKNSQNECLIKQLKQAYKEIEFKVFNYEKSTIKQVLIRILKQIIKQKYSCLLFLQKINIHQQIKQNINKIKENKRVLSHTLKFQKTHQRVQQFGKLQKDYYIQKRKAKSVDFIDKRLNGKSLIQHLRQIRSNNIQTYLYNSFQQFKQKYENQQQFFNPFVICTYSILNQLKEYLMQKVNKVYFNNCKIICFDTKQKINILKKQLVFQKNPLLAFSSSNIRQIIQFIQTSICEYLLTDIDTAAGHLQKYQNLKKKFNLCKTQQTNIITMMTSPFPTYQNDFFCQQELGFIQSQNQQNLNQFIREFVEHWQTDNNPLKNFETLKKDVQDSLYFCLKHEIIKFNSQSFAQEYINTIRSCRTISQLLKVGIYIYSLPHGLSECINKLFIQYKTNLMALKKFSPFILLMVLKFSIFFSSLKIQKEKLRVYIQNHLNLNQFTVGSYIYNLNFLNCIQSKIEKQCQKDFIEIEYEYYPLQLMDQYNSLIFLGQQSIYKESFQYIFAPYSKFYVNGISKYKQNKIIELKSIHKNNFLNLFLQKLLSINNLPEYFQEEIQKQNQFFISEQERKLQLNNLNYLSFFKSLEKHQYYNAERYLLLIQSEQEDQQQKLLIDYIWILIKKGKYHQSRNRLKQLQKNCSQSLKSITSYLNKLIDSIEKKRQNELESKQKIKIWKVRYSSNQNFKIQQSSIKWKCNYLKKTDIFILKQQNQMNYYHEVPQDLTFNKDLFEENIPDSESIFKKSNHLLEMINDSIINQQERQGKQIAQNILNVNLGSFFNEEQSKLFYEKKSNKINQPKVKSIFDAIFTIQQESKQIMEEIQQKIPQKRKMKWICTYEVDHFEIKETQNKKKHLKVKKKKKIARNLY